MVLNLGCHQATLFFGTAISVPSVATQVPLPNFCGAYLRMRGGAGFVSHVCQVSTGLACIECLGDDGCHFGCLARLDVADD